MVGTFDPLPLVWVWDNLNTHLAPEAVSVAQQTMLHVALGDIGQLM